jgi:hypothetical protein
MIKLTDEFLTKVGLKIVSTDTNTSPINEPSAIIYQNISFLSGNLVYETTEK